MAHIQLQIVISDSPADTEWKIIPWAFRLCTYWMTHNPVKPPFGLPRNLHWNLDDCAIVYLVAEIPSHCLAMPPADRVTLC